MPNFNVITYHKFVLAVCTTCKRLLISFHNFGCCNLRRSNIFRPKFPFFPLVFNTFFEFCLASFLHLLLNLLCNLSPIVASASHLPIFINNSIQTFSAISPDLFCRFSLPSSTTSLHRVLPLFYCFKGLCASSSTLPPSRLPEHFFHGCPQHLAQALCTLLERSLRLLCCSIFHVSFAHSW